VPSVHADIADIARLLDDLRSNCERDDEPR
jgi:hypothetical protein